jgi:hypothetical protein
VKVVYEFIVADREKSKQLAESSIEELSIPYFRCFGLDPVNLASLYFVINDKPFSESYLQQFSVLHHDNETCDSLVEMPASLCAALASLPDQKHAAVLKGWTEKEGVSVGHWRDDFKRNVLLNLVELSKKSQDRRQPLMLKVRIVNPEVTESHTLH